MRHANYPDLPRVISQGDPDNIEKTYYTWGMQLDTVEWEDEEGIASVQNAPWDAWEHVASHASHFARGAIAVPPRLCLRLVGALPTTY